MTGISKPSGPHVVMLGGPNGAGKSTLAGVLLPRFIEIPVFVNADTLATGLSGNWQSLAHSEW